MRKLFLSFILFTVICFSESCKRQKRVSNVDPLPTDLIGSMNYRSNFPFDSTAIAPFFKSYPELAVYESNILAIYRKNSYNHIWFDRNGVI